MTPKKVLITLTLLVCFFLFAVLVVQPLMSGIMLRSKILRAISSAKTVRVVEHSSSWDNPEIRRDEYKEVIFQERILETKEIEALRRAFPISFDYNKTMKEGCIFADHHRIELQQKEGAPFVIDICFPCGQLRLNQGETQLMPMRWKNSLRHFFSDLGMKPDGSWSAKMRSTPLPPPGN